MAQIWIGGRPWIASGQFTVIAWFGAPFLLTFPMGEACQGTIKFRGARSGLRASMSINLHHVRVAAFASTSDGTLDVGQDETGIWFSASLPENADGYNINSEKPQQTEMSLWSFPVSSS
jgi:hypothetical protein